MRTISILICPPGQSNSSSDSHDPSYRMHKMLFREPGCPTSLSSTMSTLTSSSTDRRVVEQKCTSKTLLGATICRSWTSRAEKIRLTDCFATSKNQLKTSFFFLFPCHAPLMRFSTLCHYTSTSSTSAA